MQLLQPEWGRLFVVHRLDKDTSGVMIFARNEAAHRALNAQFAERKIRKTYVAFCAGTPEWNSYHANLPLLVDGDRSHRTVADPARGKPAQTELIVLKRLNLYTEIEAHPHTGYTHQIRAHLSTIGFPILGDPLYRYPPDWSGPRIDRKTLPVLTRMALHALKLTFLHPISGESVAFEAPLPPDLALLSGL